MFLAVSRVFVRFDRLLVGQNAFRDIQTIFESCVSKGAGNVWLAVRLLTLPLQRPWPSHYWADQPHFISHPQGVSLSISSLVVAG